MNTVEVRSHQKKVECKNMLIVTTTSNMIKFNVLPISYEFTLLLFSFVSVLCMHIATAPVVQQHLCQEVKLILGLYARWGRLQSKTHNGITWCVIIALKIKAM